MNNEVTNHLFLFFHYIGRGQMNPQQELMFLQRESGVSSDQMRSSGLLGGDPGLYPPRGDPFLPSGRPAAAMLYDQYLMGGLPPPQDGHPYNAAPVGRGRGLDMLYPPPRGQGLPPISGSLPGRADVARMPPQQLRGMDPLLSQPYNDLLPDGRGFASRGLDPGMARGFGHDPYMEFVLAQRYPYTAAALGGGGLDRSQLSLDLDRAQASRRIEEQIGMMDTVPAVPVNPNAITLYVPEDDQSLSQYQCAVRKQIEIFEAGPIDVDTNAQGRNKPIMLGQVGIRCLHCSMIHPKRRARGGTYYPSKFSGFYQAAQNMASGHLCEHCPHVPQSLRRQLLILRERKSSAGGGKNYWAEAVKALGVIEDTEDGVLRFKKDNEDIGEAANQEQEQKKSDEPDEPDKAEPTDS